VALRAALDAAVKADDPLLGAELLQRARTRAADPQLTASTRAAEAKLAHRVGLAHVSCVRPCEAEIDGVALGSGALPAAGASKPVLPGNHSVLFRIDGRSARVPATIAIDQIVEVVPPDELLHPPVAAPIAPVTPVPIPVAPVVASPIVHETHPSSPGISRAWFWAGIAVTASAGVGGVVLLRRASVVHSDGHTYTIAGDATLGVAGAAGVFTLVSGLWLVHWKDSGVSATVSPTAAVASWSCSF
jgi:hypothetical protein